MTHPLTDETLYLGIDGGGSKCHAVLYRPGDGVIGTGVAGPANPLQGYERALVSISEAAAAAVHEAGLPGSAIQTLAAGIGLAGLNISGQRERMERWQHPFATVRFATDLEIACLGAHDGDDGAVIIAGTGSSGYVRVGQHEHTIGGSGFPAGDIASGAWLGLRALQVALQAADGLAPATRLQSLVDAHFGVSGNHIVERIAGAPTSVYAELAPLVFAAAEDGDTAARSIVTEGADYLGRMARKLKEHRPPRLSLIGGVAPAFAAWLDEDVRESLAPAIHSPAVGAVLLIRRQAAPASAGRRLVGQS